LASTWRNFPLVDKALCAYLFFVFALTFVLSLAPPTGADYDSLTYHLAAPAQYLQHGSIIQLPYDHHTYFPFNLEMLYLIGLQLSGPVLAKLFHWLMLPLCCGALYAIGARYLSARSGLFAACLFAALPLVQSEATTAYIDLGLVAFSLLALLCFLRWKEALNGRWLLLSGVFCGFCLGTKYTGILTLAWLGLGALLVMAQARRWQWQPVLGFLGLTVLFGGGWYLRNWWWTGNPVYPFAYGIFGGRGWTQAMADRYVYDQAQFGFGKSLVDWIYLPWRLAMAPLNVGVDARGMLVGQPFWPVSGAPVAAGGAPGMFDNPFSDLLIRGTIGPLMLALGLPLFFVSRKPAPVKFCGLSFIVLLVVWAIATQQVRLVIMPLAVGCLLCGWGMQVYAHRTSFCVCVLV
jgi:4-amino-4-deoxy-L-arabinose transferase-like glycosyltransferase